MSNHERSVLLLSNRVFVHIFQLYGNNARLYLLCNNASSVLIISVVLPTWPVILVKIRGNVAPFFNFGFQVVYSCIMCNIV